MRTIQLCIASLFILVSTSAYCQSNLFNVLHDNDGLSKSDGINTILPNVLGSYITFASCNTINDDHAVCISIFDQNGLFEHSRSYSIPGEDLWISTFGHNAHKCNTGEFVLNVYGDSTTYIWLVNSDGDTIWSRPLPASNLIGRYAMSTQLPSGEILAAGTGVTATGIYKMFFARYDMNGTVTGYNEIQLGSTQMNAKDLKVTSTGQVILLGTRINYFGDDFDGWIASIDTNYSLQWLKYVDAPGEDDAGYMTLLPSGEIAVCGVSTMVDNAIPTPNFYSRLRYTLFSTSGSVVIDSIYPTLDHLLYVHDVKLKDGDSTLLVTGVAYRPYSGDLDAFILNLDPNMDSLWYKQYYQPDTLCFLYRHWPNSMIIESDGSIIIGGTRGDCVQDQWIMKTDGAGVPPPSMLLFTSVDDHLIAPEKDAVIYPNPAHDMVYLDIAKEWVEHWTLYNSLGVQVNVTMAPQGHSDVLSIDVSSVPPGIYLLVSTGRDGAAFQARFIKQ